MRKQELINEGLKLGLELKIIEEIILAKTDLTKSQFFSTSPLASLQTPPSPLIEGEHGKEANLEKEILEGFKKYSSGYPLEYVKNKAEFYGLDFFVDERVLIPRDDTEVMVGEVLKMTPPKSSSPEGDLIGFPPRVRGVGGVLIDIGTGSSCIPISILKNTDYFEKCYVVDISKKALEVSKINIEKHGLKNNVKQIEGNLFTPILSLFQREYPKWEGLNKSIIITANLPYIKNGDHKNMDGETVEFEPDLALYGGEKTGFELYEKLIQQILELKNSPSTPKERGLGGFYLFIEIGFDQFEYSKKYLENLGLKFKYFKDNSGINRCIKIEF